MFKNMFCKSDMFPCTKARGHVKNANIHLKYYSNEQIINHNCYYFQFCDVVTLAIIHKEKSI